MVRRLLPLVLLALLVSPATYAAPADSQSNNKAGGSQRLENGVAHFDRAFYQLTPHKREAEAAREFELAITEFEAELRATPSSVEAHRYLGRIFNIRKQFLRAAHHYDDISVLLPYDVDALVLAAAAYADAGRFDEARERLLSARGRTTDTGALARLDEYLSRLDQRAPRGAAERRR